MKGFLKFLGSNVGKWIMIFLFGIICSVILYALAMARSEIINAAIVIIIVVVGWRTISFIQPNVFIALGPVGTIFYFVLKLALSVILGVFCVPYKIGKFTSEQIQKHINRAGE